VREEQRWNEVKSTTFHRVTLAPSFVTPQKKALAAPHCGNRSNASPQEAACSRRGRARAAAEAQRRIVLHAPSAASSGTRTPRAQQMRFMVTSNTSVALGGTSGGEPRLPYLRQQAAAQQALRGWQPRHMHAREFGRDAQPHALAHAQAGHALVPALSAWQPVSARMRSEQCCRAPHGSP
jgi:hypothetical protein